MIPPVNIKKTTIKDYLIIVRKRIMIVAVFVVIVTGVVSFREYSTPQTYQAQTKIIFESFQKSDIFEKANQESQLELLKSKILAEKVIKKLKLVRMLTGESYPSEITKAVRDMFSKVRVKVDRASQTADVIVRGTDPVKVAKIANTWVREFIEKDNKTRIVAARSKKEVLEKQVAEALEKLEKAGKELELFLKSNKTITSLDARGKMEETIESLRTHKAQLEKEIITKLQAYREEHPKITVLREKAEGVEEKLKKQIEELRSFQDKTVEYKLLRRDIDQNRASYESLLERLKEAAFWKKPVASNIKIVSEAKVPTKVIRPKPLEEIPKAILLALFLGIISCFILECCDTMLRSQEELKIYTGLPFLGQVPLAKKWTKDVNIELITQLNSSSQTAEGFRKIKNSIVFSAAQEKPIKSMVITSATPKEGKTIVASNMAITFAQAKEETLLIDADMRKGNINQGFGLETKNGLSSVLAGICDLEKVIIPTSIPNLSVVLSGPYAPNPMELINSKTLRDVLSQAAKKFQRVVIDAPPLLAVADALMIGRNCDGIVFVARANQTSLKHIIEAKKVLAKTKVIGTILNGSSK